jgi:N-acetyl-anhydromuramyl-L-alanine amidase AmpD
MHHGHNLNSFTFGIEIECRARGWGGAFWPKRSDADRLAREATDEQLDALVAVMDWCESQLGPLTWYAHRQGHASRTTDPGERIWNEITAQGFTTDPDATFGSGSAIP